MSTCRLNFKSLESSVMDTVEPRALCKHMALLELLKCGTHYRLSYDNVPLLEFLLGFSFGVLPWSFLWHSLVFSSRLFYAPWHSFWYSLSCSPLEFSPVFSFVALHGFRYFPLHSTVTWLSSAVLRIQWIPSGDSSTIHRGCPSNAIRSSAIKSNHLLMPHQQQSVGDLAQ